MYLLSERLLQVVTTEGFIEESDIDKLIKELQECLILQHWIVTWEITSDIKMGHSLMKIVPTRPKTSARIYIRESLIGRPTNEFVPLLLHEMVHLVIDPIVEEYILQIQYEIPSTRMIEYHERLVRVVEKTVQHLTDNFSRLIKLPLSVPLYQKKHLPSQSDDLADVQNGSKLVQSPRDG